MFNKKVGVKWKVILVVMFNIQCLVSGHLWTLTPLHGGLQCVYAIVIKICHCSEITFILFLLKTF